MQIVAVAEQDKSALVSELDTAEVLLHVLSPVGRELMDGAPRLRLIQKLGTGVNTIDRAYAAERGIRVANTPGANSQAVAEHTLALMLAVLRHVPQLDSATRSGNGWAQSAHHLERSGEVSGRVVGFVGFGAVPRLLTPVLMLLGAKVICFARSTSKISPEIRNVGLVELFQTSDIVSLHLPLCASTEQMITAQLLGRMKAGSILINTARGGLIREMDLVKALQRGPLAAAGLDVFAEEPVPRNSTLLALDNAVLSPHVAWYTPESIRRSLDAALENCRRLRAGELILNEVLFGH